MKPYIGITGFKTPAEIVGAAQLFSEHLRYTGYTAMFGFIASAKRLADPSSYGDCSPSVNDLSSLTALVPEQFLPMIHYYTPDKDSLVDDVLRLFRDNYIYDSCQALQINMTWPEVRDIESIKYAFPDMKIVLQIKKQALQEPLEKLVNKVKAYDELIDYILVDPSGGGGKDFILDECVAAMNAASHAIQHVCVGLAGGLSGDNVYERVTSVAAKVNREFSIDAQGKLRVEVFGESFLNPEKVKRYIENAAKAVKER